MEQKANFLRTPEDPNGEADITGLLLALIRAPSSK
jgi:hypothetical protein